MILRKASLVNWTGIGMTRLWNAGIVWKCCSSVFPCTSTSTSVKTKFAPWGKSLTRCAIKGAERSTGPTSSERTHNSISDSRENGILLARMKRPMKNTMAATLHACGPGERASPSTSAATGDSRGLAVSPLLFAIAPWAPLWGLVRSALRSFSWWLIWRRCRRGATFLLQEARQERRAAASRRLPVHGSWHPSQDAKKIPLGQPTLEPKWLRIIDHIYIYSIYIIIYYIL